MKKKTAAAVASAFAAGFVVAVVGLVVSAFVVMIFVGMWHGHNDAVPALGFVDCLYGVGLVGLLSALVAPSTRS
ncbi:hypothetical protein SEA_SHAWTY_25 [Streptomyces phage Shawty]|uniref:Uncharacterized protein n=1 Tax=Streptomyces phage Shawty TaxID=2510521 RepID=A0A411CYG3_9CAUD|nr:hypothetical protein SEA_SHAWTY_25 [Streptomyces phage Shawty]